MALKDDLATTVTALETAAQTITAAVNELRTTAGTVPDADVQSAMTRIAAVSTELTALAQPPAPPPQPAP